MNTRVEFFAVISPLHSIQPILVEKLPLEGKQGWLHGNPVADKWAGAVMQNLLSIQKYYETYRQTDQHGKV